MDKFRKLVRKTGFVKSVAILTVASALISVFLVSFVLVGIFSKTPEPYILVLSIMLPLVLVPMVISGAFLVYIGFDKTDEKLMKMANLDSLTKIYNRYYILETLQNEMKRVDRYSGKLCLAVFDIIGFKRINSMHGYAIGDELLQLVIERMHRILRSSDTLGRSSGDEFIIVLPAISEKEAISLGKRIADTISSENFACGDYDIPVRINFGAVEYNVGETMENLIMRAEKDMGRKKVSAGSGKSAKLKKK